jgi:hypothetical protein
MAKKQPVKETEENESAHEQSTQQQPVDIGTILQNFANNISGQINTRLAQYDNRIQTIADSLDIFKQRFEVYKEKIELDLEKIQMDK